MNGKTDWLKVSASSSMSPNFFCLLDDKVLATSARASLRDGGKLSTYSTDVNAACNGASTRSLSLSGDKDRGGVLALDARLPRSLNLLSRKSRCFSLNNRYVMDVMQKAMPSSSR